MASYSKLGYGNFEGIDAAVESGVLNGKDIVITKDTSELVYIRDDNSKQIIRSRVRRFESESEALEAVNGSLDSYAGQIVSIKNESGKYVPYTVQNDTENTGKFVVEQIVTSGSAGFAWQEF